eukprot:TRINITY_DN5166_c0_g1_i1.p1 TRINITY_DN5166_c0_g1~~TRINITY_DN5166_c0_g1_i1.p1  ORF type:complete len:65 (-),score=6.49 TRINITY_DN5166_c0_g1_i1:28-222(-)
MRHSKNVKQALCVSRPTFFGKIMTPRVKNYSEIMGGALTYEKCDCRSHNKHLFKTINISPCTLR